MQQDQEDRNTDQGGHYPDRKHHDGKALTGERPCPDHGELRDPVADREENTAEHR